MEVLLERAVHHCDHVDPPDDDSKKVVERQLVLIQKHLQDTADHLMTQRLVGQLSKRQYVMIEHLNKYAHLLPHSVYATTRTHSTRLST